VLDTYSVGDGASGIATDGDSLWVALNGLDRVLRLRPGDGALLESHATGRAPLDLAFDGKRLWVANSGTGSVTAIDISAP
jgi:DNA-binding beta-propeller fold protein YncE